MKSSIFALIACCWYATANFIIGNKSSLGFLASSSLSQGHLVYGMIYWYVYSLRRICQRKKIWTWKKSSFRFPTGGLNCYNTMICILYTINQLWAAILVVLCYYFSENANINQGIISSLFGLSGLFSAVGANIFFNEKLRKAHYIGIGLMLLCVIGISFGSIESDHNNFQPSSEPTEFSSPKSFDIVLVPNNTPSNAKGGSSKSLQISPNGLSYATSTILAIILGILSPFAFCWGGMIIRFSQKGPIMKKNEPGFNHFDSNDLTISM